MKATVERGNHEREFVFKREDGKEITIYFRGRKYQRYFSFPKKTITIYSWKPVMGEEQTTFLNLVDEISGETYPIRDFIKNLGFRWNPAQKVWERKMKNERRGSR